MSVVLYVLGAGLLAWSASIVLGGDTFAAMDIAASLAGWGVFAIGLGALTGAVGKLTRTVAENGRPRRQVGAMPARSKAQAPDGETAQPPVPARRLPAAAALPPEGSEPVVVVETDAPAGRPARRVIKQAPDMTSAPDIESPSLGGGFAARLERNIAEAEAPPVMLEQTASAGSSGAEGGARQILPPAVSLRVDRPRVERAPAVVAPVRDEPEEVQPIEAVAPSVVEGEEPGPPPSEPAGAVEAPVRESRADRIVRLRAARVAAAPRPQPEAAPEPEPALDPPADAVPAFGLAATPLPKPEPAPTDRPPQDEQAVQDPKVPEWLARARARRRARIDTDDAAASQAVMAGPDERVSLQAAPEPVAEPETTPAPVTETGSAPEVAAGPTLIREGEHRGVTYRFYDDESVEAVSEHGVRRFGSVEELRATVRSARGSEDPTLDAAPDRAPDGDPLDAALAELEGRPALEVIADPRDRIGSFGRG